MESTENICRENKKLNNKERMEHSSNNELPFTEDISEWTSLINEEESTFNHWASTQMESVPPIYTACPSLSLPISTMSTLVDQVAQRLEFSKAQNESLIAKLREEAIIEEELRRASHRNTILSGNSRMVNVACLLGVPQRQASRILGVPNSTFSKKWRNKTNNKKWPYRIVRRLSKEIQTIEANIPISDPTTVPMMQANLERLQADMKKEIQPVYLSL